MTQTDGMLTAFKQSYSEILTHIESIQIHLQEMEEEFLELESILEELNQRIKPSHHINNMLHKMEKIIMQEKNDPGAGSSNGE